MASAVLFVETLPSGESVNGAITQVEADTLGLTSTLDATMKIIRQHQQVD